MAIWREESGLIISVLHGAILLARAAVVHDSFRADLAMRGCAISFLMRARVALLDSFLGSLMVLMSTLKLYGKALLIRMCNCAGRCSATLEENSVGSLR